MKTKGRSPSSPERRICVERLRIVALRASAMTPGDFGSAPRCRRWSLAKTAVLSQPEQNTSEDLSFKENQHEKRNP